MQIQIIVQSLHNILYTQDIHFYERATSEYQWALVYIKYL